MKNKLLKQMNTSEKIVLLEYIKKNYSKLTFPWSHPRIEYLEYLIEKDIEKINNSFKI